MKKLSLLTFFSIFLFSTLITKAQNDDYEDNDIFKSIVQWDVRRGIENQTFTQHVFNNIIQEDMGTEKLEYKNRRVTIDGIHADFCGTLADLDPVKIGLLAGCNVGISFQTNTYDNTVSGTTFHSDYPSGFAGDQGSDLASEKWALSFELKAGAGIAYNIIPQKNFQVSVGYSERFWSKGNMGFYVVPKFFGGFFDVNATYRNWSLYTTFRAKSYEADAMWGEVKSNYISVMPTYNFSGGTFIGLRFENTHAQGDNTIVLQNSFTKDYTLRSNSILAGIYFGFTY